MANLPYRLMTPGPVPIFDEVLQSLALPMVHHRSEEFSKELTLVLDELKVTFQTSQPVLMTTSTASGAMEAALINTLSPGDEILNIESGKFSERWTQVAQCHGLRVHVLRETSGYPLDLGKIQEALSSKPHIKAVTLSACETSTGTQNPIFEVSQILQCFPKTLLIVDATTAIGAMNLPMDDWSLDVVISGSQKSFMLPAGLGFVALSQKAWERNRQARCPRFYFDLRSEMEANQKGYTRFSAPVTYIRALRLTLRKLNQGDGQYYMHRCQALSQVTQEAVRALGLELFSQAPAPSLTAVRVPQGLDGEKVKEHLLKHFNIAIAGGQGVLKGKIWRIGHLGAITDEDLVATVEGLGKSLWALGWREVELKEVEAIVKRARERLQNWELR